MLSIGAFRLIFIAFLFFCAYLKCFKTFTDPTDFEIRSINPFLNARNVKPTEIHRQVKYVYGENALSDGMVKKWVKIFLVSLMVL